MSKISLKCILEDSKGKHIYNGKAILKNNTITYKDNGIMTKVVMDDVVWISREQDYKLKIGFKNNEEVFGIYETPYGGLQVKTETLFLKKHISGLEIKYRLTINNVYVDTFLLNFSYSIDTIKKYV